MRNRIPFPRRLPCVLFYVTLPFLSGFIMGHADDLDVGPAGAYATIQAAIDHALPFDRIRVARGRYEENLYVSCTSHITLSGGWSTDYRRQSSDPSLTIVDGGGVDQCLATHGTLAVENMTFENGFRDPEDCWWAAAGITASTVEGPVDLWLEDVVVQDCHADWHPAGILLTSTAHPLHVDMRRVVVRRNTGDPWGHGMWIDAMRQDPSEDLPGGEAVVFISGSLIHTNAARSYGAGIYAYAGVCSSVRLMLVNTTVTDNTTSGSDYGLVGPGAGVHVRDGACGTNYVNCEPGTMIFEVYNSIIYGNHGDSPGTDVGVLAGSETSRFEYYSSDIGDVDYHSWRGGGATVTGILEDDVLSVDPVFMNPAAGDYRLGVGSPLVDGGTMDVPDPPGLCTPDLDETPRPSGSGLDIGCDEVNMEWPEIYFPRCMASTAVKGTDLEKDLDAVRAFRDQVLMQTARGQIVVHAYYEASPVVSRALIEHEELRSVTRMLLVPVFWLLSSIFGCGRGGV